MPAACAVLPGCGRSPRSICKASTWFPGRTRCHNSAIVPWAKYPQDSTVRRRQPSTALRDDTDRDCPRTFGAESLFVESCDYRIADFADQLHYSGFKFVLSDLANCFAVRTVGFLILSAVRLGVHAQILAHSGQMGCSHHCKNGVLLGLYMLTGQDRAKWTREGLDASLFVRHRIERAILRGAVLGCHSKQEVFPRPGNPNTHKVRRP
jgi:hypothetical protein